MVLPGGSAVFSETEHERSGGVGIDVEGTTGGGMEGTTSGGMGVRPGGVRGTIGGASGATIDLEIGWAVCRVLDRLGLAAAGRVGLGFSSETGDPCEPGAGDDGTEEGSLCNPDKRPAEGRRDMCGQGPELGSATAGDDVPSATKFGGKEELVFSAEMSGQNSVEGGAGAGFNS